MNKEQILYEDKDIIVCHKPAGLAVQTAKIGQRDMVSEVSNYLGAPVKLVHRLDQPVEGILVFAKNQKAAGELGRQITSNQMAKYYYAVVSVNRDINIPSLNEETRILSNNGETGIKDAKNEITLINYLSKDNDNTSHVVTKDKIGAKKAELRYSMLSHIPAREFYEENNGRFMGYNDANSYESLMDFEDMYIALVRIRLITGRHHQIRVQMSNVGMSLIGDYKYADEKARQLSELLCQKNVALCAYELIFNHPISGKRMTFHKEPEGQIFQNFSL